jgi:hypothetical protein
MHFRGRVVVLTLALAAALAAPARASVIISEIMFNPAGSDNDSLGTDYTYTREWVELYNTDPAPIDVSGWRFGDALDNNWASPFPQGTVIGGNQTLIVSGARQFRWNQRGRGRPQSAGRHPGPCPLSGCRLAHRQRLGR